MRAGGDTLLIAPSLTAYGGGIELYLRQFLHALSAIEPEGRLHAVLATERTLARPELFDAALRDRLKVTGASDGPRLRRVAALLVAATRAVVATRPTLVVCGHVHYATLAWLLARLCGARLVVLAYGIEAWELRGAVARAVASADRVIAISSYTAERLAECIGIPRSSVAVIHNAVDTARFSRGVPSQRLRARLEPLARPRLLTVCRLDAREQYKGVDTVMRAIARHPGLCGSYLVVGDGTDRPRLEALGQELGVPVTFWGRASDEELVDLYRACDLFVMVSRNEGFGYVFIEAMACGLPVIGGNRDGSVDALGEGALGLLVDPDDEEALATAIRAHLDGTSPAALRDPAHLGAEVRTRFSATTFRARLAEAMATLTQG